MQGLGALSTTQPVSLRQEVNEKHETLEKTLAKEEDKPGGSLMAALSPYEIPANTPGELHWIYSLWVSYGGHLIFLGMEFLEFPAVNGENAKPAVRSGGALPPPRMTPHWAWFRCQLLMP